MQNNVGNLPSEAASLVGQLRDFASAEGLHF